MFRPPPPPVPSGAPPPAPIAVAPPPRKFQAPSSGTSQTMRPPPPTPPHAHAQMTQSRQRTASVEVIDATAQPPPPPALASPPPRPTASPPATPPIASSGGFVSRGPPPTPPPAHATRPGSMIVQNSPPPPRAPPAMAPAPTANSFGPTSPNAPPPVPSGGPPIRSPPPARNSTMLSSTRGVNVSGGWVGQQQQSGGHGAEVRSVDSSPPAPTGPPPRTLFDVTPHRAKDPKRDCKVDHCYSRSEIGGFCVSHYYASQSTPSAAPPASPSPSHSARSTPAGSMSVENLGKKEDERRQLCEELVLTEKSYGQGLKKIVKGMILRLNKYDELNPGKGLIGLMDREEMQKSFLNIADIFDLQQKLYGELKKLRFERELLGPALGKVLITFAPFFRLYVTYVNQFDESQKTLSALREERPALDAFFRHCEAVEGTRVADCMISPVQRVPRYALLLRAIEKSTDPSDGSLAGVRTALSAIEQVASDINESFRKKESRARVVEIAQHIEGLEEQLVTPHRYFIKDGPLEKRYNKTSFKINDWKGYHWFLFNDLLIYTTIPNARGFCKMKFTLPLTDMEVVDVPNDDKLSHAFEIKSSVKSFTVMAGSAQEKLAWMEAINTAKEKLNQNTSTLKLLSPSGTKSHQGSISVNLGSPNGSSRQNSFFIGGNQTLPVGFKMPQPQ